MGREKNRPKMSASANGSRLDERRVSGRAEVTVRCENSFESSPRLIVEEGRSPTGLICRSCSPLSPSCSCYPNRKVAIAIGVRSTGNTCLDNTHRYLTIFITFIYAKLFSPPSPNSRFYLSSLLSRNSILRRQREIVKERKRRDVSDFNSSDWQKHDYDSHRLHTDESIRIGRFSYRGKTRYEWNRVESSRIGLKDIDASPQRTVIISDRMSVCRSAE